MTKPKRTIQDYVREMTAAHSNINAYQAVINVMEGGTIYGGRHEDSSRIIHIAKRAQQKELKIYDAAHTSLLKEALENGWEKK